MPLSSGRVQTQQWVEDPKFELSDDCPFAHSSIGQWKTLQNWALAMTEHRVGDLWLFDREGGWWWMLYPSREDAECILFPFGLASHQGQVGICCLEKSWGWRKGLYPLGSQGNVPCRCSRHTLGSSIQSFTYLGSTRIALSQLDLFDVSYFAIWL